MTALQTGKYKELYEKYKYDELTFSGTIIKSSGIIQRDIYLTAGSSKWPCTILSVSMIGIKISVNLSVEEISEVTAASSVQVKFSFMGLKPHFIPISFLIPYRITELTNTSNLQEENHLLIMDAVAAPHDFLIRILGELMSVQKLTTKRAEMRITINTDTAEELKLKSILCRLRKDDEWLDCRLQDLSFSGCKIIMNNLPSVENKSVLLQILFRDPDTIAEIPGKVSRYMMIKESGDKAAAGICFEEEHIPHEYTMRLHDLLD